MHDRARACSEGGIANRGYFGGGPGAIAREVNPPSAGSGRGFHSGTIHDPPSVHPKHPAPPRNNLGDVARDTGDIGRDVGEVGRDKSPWPPRSTLTGCPMTDRKMAARHCWRPCHGGALSAPVSALLLRALRTVGASVPCIRTARACGSGYISISIYLSRSMYKDISMHILTHTCQRAEEPAVLV